MTPRSLRRRAPAGLVVLAFVAVPLTVASLTGTPRREGGARPETAAAGAGAAAEAAGSFEASAAEASSTLPPLSGRGPAADCRLPELEFADRFACAAAILVEMKTGAVLYGQAADSSRAPASLAKMMLEVLAFEDLASGRASIGDSVVVSDRAAGMGGATVEILPGERVAFGNLLEAVVLVSANDAAVAIAEHLAGSEPAFVLRMNARAAELGCAATRFVNCHGLDVPPEESRSSARDLAAIARRLLELPESLRFAAIAEAPFRGGALSMKSTNELLGVLEGVDGLKTGFTSRAGGCFCGTIERGGVRFVSVVLGAAPGAARFEITRALFESAYAMSPRWVEAARLGAPAPGDAPSGRVLLAGSVETR